MIVRFETTIPDDPKTALARAEALLSRYGFTKEAEGRYVRGSRLGSGTGLRPRQVLAKLTLHADGSGVGAELKTDPTRVPTSTLERHLWRGEMDDLRAALENVPGPGLDRAREDYATSILVGVTMVTVFVVLAVAIPIFYPRVWPAAIVALLPIVVYAVFPFRMPRYPLQEAPRDVSNYPR